MSYLNMAHLESRLKGYGIDDTDDDTTSATGDPCRNVVAACVQQAVDDLGSTTRPVRRTLKELYPKSLAEQAFWWLFCDEGERVLSLAWCCGVLGVTKRDVRLYADAQHPMVCWRMAGVWAAELVKE